MGRNMDVAVCLGCRSAYHYVTDAGFKGQVCKYPKVVEEGLREGCGDERRMVAMGFCTPLE
jgi:dienelactone hydrolase